MCEMPRAIDGERDYGDRVVMRVQRRRARYCGRRRPSCCGDGTGYKEGKGRKPEESEGKEKDDKGIQSDYVDVSRNITVLGRRRRTIRSSRYLPPRTAILERERLRDRVRER